MAEGLWGKIQGERLEVRRKVITAVGRGPVKRGAPHQVRERRFSVRNRVPLKTFNCLRRIIDNLYLSEKLF